MGYAKAHPQTGLSRNLGEFGGGKLGLFLELEKRSGIILLQELSSRHELPSSWNGRGGVGSAPLWGCRGVVGLTPSRC